MTANTPAQPPPQSPAPHHVPSLQTWLSRWGGFLAKNALGWLLIVASFVLGPFVPGPGGIPLFIIGFGLITFPGKRRITARVFRGIPFRRDTRGWRRGSAIAGLLIPGAAVVYLLIKSEALRRPTLGTALLLGGGYAAGALAAWWVALHSVGCWNWVLRIVARVRRKIRPWMRHHGIDLLPPRRRARFVAHQPEPTRDPDPEILAIHDRFHRRVRLAWAAARPWLGRIVALGITAAIFVWILKPIVREWDTVRGRLLEMDPWPVLGASVMFAAFLFAFRVTTWRKIIKGLGNRLPLAPATRIWSSSELARYLPGVIWQVVGRAYLCKPYGVSGRVCSTSQVLELVVFLLANLIVAVSCLWFLGYKNMDGLARLWLVAAAALVPVLLVVVHPSIFYRLVNGLLVRLGKPPLERRLRYRKLLTLLGWSVAGLIWQGLAIWVVVHEVLGLPLAKWWVVTGAYCLAWCAGFLAVWAPGGIGVREAVFIAAMEFALPRAVRHGVLGDPSQRLLFLTFLSVLLRIWATAGELMLAGVGYVADYRGALGRPGATGVRAASAPGTADPHDLHPDPPDEPAHDSELPEPVADGDSGHAANAPGARMG